MRIKLAQFLEQLCKAATQGARAGVAEAVRLAGKADELDVGIPIADEKLHVEGASNLPPTILQTKRLTASTRGFLELNDEGELVVTMKRGLLKTAPELTIEIDFERSDPLQSMEEARDLANAVNKHRHQPEALAKINKQLKET